MPWETNAGFRVSYLVEIREQTNRVVDEIGACIRLRKGRYENGHVMCLYPSSMGSSRPQVYYLPRIYDVLGCADLYSEQMEFYETAIEVRPIHILKTLSVSCVLCSNRPFGLSGL